VLGRLGAEVSRIARILRAFIPAPGMPEVGVPLKILPFLAIGSRDGMADITTKGFARGIIRRALLTAIEGCHRGVEAIVEPADIQ
jgi:hypothetical protein